MNKQSLTKLVNNSKAFVAKRSPEILTAVGIASAVASTILAVKATPKALQLIEEQSHIDADTHEVVKPTKKEIIKVTWKCYVPAVTTGIFSAACLIGAQSVNARRNAALATAYKLSETALIEYKDKVIETIGEKKEKTIRNNVAKGKIEKNPVSKNEVIITEKGNTLCYDAVSGRYFKSDIDKINKAINELNRRMISEMYVSLNEFYNEIGLESTTIGDDIGWNVDFGLIEADFSSMIADDGTPCIVIDYLVAPRYNYSKLM